MKKQILSVVTLLSLAVALSVAALANLSATIRAEIPFDFTVGNETFSAGKYRIAKLNPTGATVIQNTETKKSQAFQVFNGKTGRGNQTVKLVFNRYGNQYFLNQIWDGSERNMELVKSKAERELKKTNHLAQNNAETEVITIAAQIGN